jgi:diaminopimelate decarboxylase
MVASNELNTDELCYWAELLFNLAAELHKQLWITFEYINIGGGFGIPYKPDQSPLDIAEVGKRIEEVYREKLLASWHPETAIVTESWRYITGPFGYLITRALHEKHTYKDYIGVDACMANLMRPWMYGSYHHISIVWSEDTPQDHTYDIVGWLCENNDKFAIDRILPKIIPGDLLVIHDTGAHGHSMGFNYNAKLRSAEVLLCSNGTTKLIRRAETLDDYFATAIF